MSGPPAEKAAAGFSGTPKEIPFRAEMERAFGLDFGHVRAYTGPDASAAAQALGAEAYAVGSQIAFRDATPSRETVAHELTHVVQNSAGGARASTVQARGSEVSSPDDAHEREADKIGAAVASGQSVVGQVGDTPGLGDGVHRKTDFGLPRNQYELKIKLKDFNRVSLEGTLTVSKKKNKAVSAKHQTEAGPTFGASLIDSKQTLERGAGKWSEQLAITVGKADLSGNLDLPGFEGPRGSRAEQAGRAGIAMERDQRTQSQVARVALALLVVIAACDRERPAPPAPLTPAVVEPSSDTVLRPDAAPSLLDKERGTWIGSGTLQGTDHLFGDPCKRGKEAPQPPLPFPVATPAASVGFGPWCLDGDTFYYPKGTKAGEGKLIGGRPDGAWTYYHESGQRLLSGRYINGDADGLWRAYAPDGTVTQLGCFQAGNKQWGVTGDKSTDDC